MTVPVGITIPCFNVAGPVQIWTSTGATNAMEFLGFTRGGIEIQEQAFISELKSDYSGGEQGPPSDYQYLGEMHSITAELAQYNTAILAKLERRVNAGIVARTKGQLIGCTAGQFRVLFIAANFARNYTNVFITEPVQYAPIGMNASFPRIVFTGLENTSVNASGSYLTADASPWNSSYTVTGSVVT